MAGYWPRFFLRFDWPWLRLGPVLPWIRGFSRAVSGFGQVLWSDLREKHAFMTSVMAGYWLSYFFAFSQTEIPWVPEVFSRGFAARVLGLRLTKLVVARKNKPLVPRVSRSMKTRKRKKKKKLANTQPSRLSTTHAFRAWLDRNRAWKASCTQGRTETRSRSTKTQKSEANVLPSWSNKRG